jgi:16S rRNA U1498 N3-methylase RsmE
VVRSFRKFVEDIDPALSVATPIDRIALHPHVTATLSDVLTGGDSTSAPHVLLAFGPESGFVEAELESLRAAAYRLARLQTGPLKTEVAVAAALGQLLLLRPPPVN